MKAQLILEDGSIFDGISFGWEKSVSAEVVFTTGMVGYPESLTDPSYYGQILILTYPLIGNYGVPEKKYWESDSIKVSGLIVSSYIDTPSHYQSTMTLSSWLKKEKIPAIEIKDTRYLAQKIREQGTMLGKIVIGEKKDSLVLKDPNEENLVNYVSTNTIEIEEWSAFAEATVGKIRKTVLLLDCGVKKSIKRSLLKRGVRLITVPWNFDIVSSDLRFDAVLISNGPGDPKKVKETILTVKKLLENKVPTFGICLGNQILALAGGGDTHKLKFGHRGQNQPCLLQGSNRAYLTTQNHGFAVCEIPFGFKPWFINVNDNTNEGIIHTKYPFMSVQFHPEAAPGPVDTQWLFDFFLKELDKRKSILFLDNQVVFKRI